MGELDALVNPPSEPEPLDETEKQFWRWRPRAWFGDVYRFEEE
jgi:hypothetical protein